jgi:hypothetical protein
MDFIRHVLDAPVLVQTFYAACVVVGAFFLYAFVFSKGTKQKDTPHTVRYVIEGGKSIYIDIKRGLAIFGSSGAGKSRSGFVPIFKSAHEKKLSVLNYDYKDFELTEFLNYFYYSSDVPTYTISPARPELSHSCNPIHTDYIQTFGDVNTIAKVLMSNLGTNPQGDAAIFSKAAESAIAGVIWRLKEDFPEHCHLPMVAAVIMGKDPGGVYNFIKHSQYASLLGKTFLDSAISEKTLGSVCFTLSDALRQIISPEIFQIFSKNDFSLAINKQPTVLNLVNHPKYESVLSPFLAVVFQMATMQMSERGRNPSIVCIDEASTIKPFKIERIPATLRSYEVGFVYGLQDKIQGVDLLGENKLKAILTNLGAKILGKANDADTAEYYQKLFELIEVSQVSISRSTNFFSGGDARESTSTKERTKHRAFEFFKLQPGNFFIFDDKGDSHKVKFKAEQCEPVKSKVINNYSKTELELNFKNILDIGKSLT